MREDEMQQGPAPIWERKPGEPNLWYARFDAFRQLGPGRSVSKAYHRCKQEQGLRSATANSLWYQTSRDWDWRERAEAWDRAQREKLRVEEEERRVQARQQRADMIDVLLGAVFHAMRRADLECLDSEEARKWLPTLRMMFKDLINAQRVELGVPAAAAADEAQGVVPFTADELLAAQRELEEWIARDAAIDTNAGGIARSHSTHKSTK